MQEEIELSVIASPNLSWESLNTVIKNAMETNIPKREQKNLSKPRHISLKYVSAIKSVKKAIHNIKNNKPTQKLSPLANSVFQKISQNPQSLKSLRKTQRILIKEKLEKTKEFIINELQSGIEKNYLRFWEKPKNALKKALGDLKPSLDLSILSDGDQLHDDPDKLNKIIINHFKNILLQKPFNLNEEWIDAYKPLSHIQPEIFNSSIEKITSSEINETLNELPKHKAPGLSLIPYEVWCNLGKSTIYRLNTLFNEILKSGHPPHHWKQSAVTLLPKKLTWSHELSDTRPISLIESSRKIFTKILNKRLTSIITKNNILSKFNFAGLKN
jgi:hypothetical protein